MSDALQRTIFNSAWLIANAERLQSALPEEWTRLEDVNAFVVGGQLRMLGVDWHTEQQLQIVLTRLQQVGIMRMADARRDGMLVTVVRRGELIVRIEP